MYVPTAIGPSLTEYELVVDGDGLQVLAIATPVDLRQRLAALHRTELNVHQAVPAHPVRVHTARLGTDRQHVTPCGGTQRVK